MNWITDEMQGAVFGGPQRYRHISKSQPPALVQDYRYTLWRWFNEHRSLEHMAAMIGMNPSTATPEKLDPTVAKWEDYARRWGYNGWCVLNVHPYRATSPEDMKAHTGGEEAMQTNLEAIRWVCQRVGLIVCAWGNDGAHAGGANAVRQILTGIGKPLRCLTINKTGEPKHPLYHRKDVKLEELVRL